MSCFGVAPSVREQGCLYTLSCVLPHTDKKKMDKKTNQFLHQLELLSSIRVQGL